MKAYEILKEYRSRVKINQAKSIALAEVKKIDDQYWLGKPIKLRQEYDKQNRLPEDHPIYIDVMNDIRKIKNADQRIV